MTKLMKKPASRLAAILTSLMMVVVFTPTFAFAAAPDITVYMTVSDQGVLAKAKDGSVMAWKEVKVRDLDGSGDHTYHEALVAAHDAYTNGGAAANYDPGTGFVKKLWGKTTDNNLFFVNDEGLSTGVTVDKVKNGDYLMASTIIDGTTWSDWYTFFDKKTGVTAKVGQEIKLTLKGHLGMAYDDVTRANVAIPDAVVKDTAGNALGKTGNDGSVSIKFSKPGTYVLTASGTVKNKMTGTNDPMIAPACVINVTKINNTIKASGKTVTIKEKKLKKKAQTVKRAKAITVSNAKGSVSYSKSSVAYTKAKSVKMSKKALKKYKKTAAKKITVAKNGKITVKKGLKKGTYKVKIKVKAAGNNVYNPVTKTVTVKIKVK